MNTSAQIADLVLDGPELKPGQTVKGELTPKDRRIPNDDSPFKPYRLNLKAGETYRITYRAVPAAQTFDPLLLIFNTRGRLINLNDDYTEDGQNLDAQLLVTFDRDQTVVIYANAVMTDEFGPFTLQVEIVSGQGTR